MLDVVKEVLISEEELKQRVAELGKQISEDYRGEDVVLVCVLKGAVMFFSDLARHITGNVTLDFISCSSYGSSTVSSGVVRILKDLEQRCCPAKNFERACAWQHCLINRTGRCTRGLKNVNRLSCEKICRLVYINTCRPR